MNGTGRQLHGLVCEDDIATRLAILVVMRQCGFESLSVVETSREALESATSTAPHMVVIDLALAGTSGFGVVREILRATPGCNVVVVSPLRGLGASARAAGAFALCELSDLRPLKGWVHGALKHGAASSDACDCQRTVGIEPSLAFAPGSRQATMSGASWRARYDLRRGPAG